MRFQIAIIISMVLWSLFGCRGKTTADNKQVPDSISNTKEIERRRAVDWAADQMRHPDKDHRTDIKNEPSAP